MASWPPSRPVRPARSRLKTPKSTRLAFKSRISNGLRAENAPIRHESPTGASFVGCLRRQGVRRASPLGLGSRPVNPFFPFVVDLLGQIGARGYWADATCRAGFIVLPLFSSTFIIAEITWNRASANSLPPAGMALATAGL